MTIERMRVRLVNAGLLATEEIDQFLADMQSPALHAMLTIYFSAWGSEHLPKGEFSDLLVNGVFSGLSGIVVFVPQIALL